MSFSDLVFMLKVIFEMPSVKAVLAIVFFLFLADLTLYVFKKYLKKIAESTEKHYDDVLLRKIELPFAGIIIFIGVRIALHILELGSSIKNLNETLLLLLLTYIVIACIDTLIDIWVDKWKERTKSEFEDEILPFIRSFIFVVISLIGLIFILKVWGIQIGPLLASLGIAGLAIGLALQNTLANIFSGVSLVMDKAFKSGDIVKLENGDVGRVKSVGIRSTQIISFDNELIIVPNKKLAESQITNYAKPNNIVRIRLPVSVAYGSNPDKVEKVLISSLKIVKDEMTKTPPLVWFNKMNDFSLDFDLVFFITDYTKRKHIKSQVIKEVYKSLKKARINIPFPTRTVYMKMGR